MFRLYGKHSLLAGGGGGVSLGLGLFGRFLLGDGRDDVRDLVDLALGADVRAQSVLHESPGALLGVVASTLEDLHATLFVRGEAGHLTDDAADQSHALALLASAARRKRGGIAAGHDVTLLQTNCDSGRHSVENR